MQVVSIRKVKAVTEELCGHSFPASTINNGLDWALAGFGNRQLEELYAHLVLDARQERVPDGGGIVHQAVLIAIGINWEGKRQVPEAGGQGRAPPHRDADFLPITAGAPQSPEEHEHGGPAE